MTEDIIHFSWRYRPSSFQGLPCDGNELIEVISPGEPNYDSGPDFFNAKVRIGNTVWAGNVEIHVKSSDWFRHGHHNDSAYDSIILHVVAENDRKAVNSKGKEVPTLEIPYPHELEWELQRLVASEAWIPCANHLKKVKPIDIRMWLASLAVERLEQKSETVKNLVNEFNGSWEEAFYVSMARSFGLKVNALPFEMMAKATPVKVLAKVKNSLLSIEALLFGQAGLLNSTNPNVDEYYLQLKKEYLYQQKKFQLNSIPGHLWKFMRLRPVAFPTIRIAQFAQLIHQSTSLFSRCIEAKTFDEISSLLKVECSTYWKNHYTFGKESSMCSKALGEETVRIIVLNTIVPFLFSYGSMRGIEELKDRALSYLESMKPEANSIVRGFALSGVKAENTFFSQSLVQLKTQYCDKRKCLFCMVGANLLLKKL